MTDCPLCTELTIDEHVLKVTDNFALIFNRYPYVEGHLMIITREHLATLNDLTADQRAELIEFINETQVKLCETLSTESSNVGINSGEWSGASIPEHLHVHIVPRFKNNIAFYNLLCRHVPERNRKMYDLIRKAYGIDHS